MNILGISGSTHDSSATLILDNKLFMAIEEERLTRTKHAVGQKPINAIKELLKRAQILPKDIDVVAYFMDPVFYGRQAPIHLFLGDPGRYLLHPKDYRTKNFLKRGRRYANDLDEIMNSLDIHAPIDYVQHHLAHAASAYYSSGFDDSMILIVDNMGELDSTTLLHGEGKNLKILGTQKIPHSLGMFYGAMTNYLGFKPWNEEGKVMALAAYGVPTMPIDYMIKLNAGSFKIRRPFQMVETLDHSKCYDERLLDIIGPARKPNEPILQRHKDIAASVQRAIEEVSKSLVMHMHSITGSRRLCVAGGVALNCKMNGELYKLPFVDEIYVPSAPGDNGSSLGAALYSLISRTGIVPEPLRVAGIGRDFSELEIRSILEQSGLQFYKSQDPSNDAAQLLMRDGVIAWYDGRSEFGPRALGHRSILALPNDETVRDYINQHVKHRELWRPLCPSISASDTTKYLIDSNDGRFMNVAFDATSLAIANTPAVIHVDKTARVQAVTEEESLNYHRLLNIIGERTGHPVLLNTSFNRRGEPIVDSPQDAINTFNEMPIKSMVIGNYVVIK